jgi:hypothetical protein
VSEFAPGSATPTRTLTGLNSPSALAFDSQGNLFVTNNNYTSGSTVSEFAATGVATSTGGVVVQTVAPVVSSSTASLPVNATNLTINGYGFDPNKANDAISFSGGVTGAVTSATATQLTVSLSDPTGQTALPPGSLSASVLVAGVSSGNPVQVATVSGSTVTSLSASSSSLNLGQSVTFTAQVAPTVGGGIPTGTVTFTDVTVAASPVVLSTATLGATGAATFTTSTLSPGKHLVEATYNGDSNFLASPPSTSLAEVVGTPTEQFVDAAYVSALHRHADPAGLAGWANAIDQGVLTRQQFASDLTHSYEFYANFVINAYQTYLGRTPVLSEINGWVGLMQNGLSDEHLDNWVAALNSGWSPQTVAYGFAASVERESQRVTADYQNFLGRSPVQSEVNGWVLAFLNGYSNEDVIAGFVGSQEYYSMHTQT